MRVPLFHLLLACMCMCVRVYVCCTIQTIIYDTRRIEKREENEKEWRERFDDELREKNASPPIFPRKERRQGSSSLLFPLFIPINTIGSIFLASTRLWKNCFETMFFRNSVRFAESGFPLSNCHGLADIIKFVRCVHARSRAGGGGYDTR